jgi:hypothetical protein
MRLLGKRTPRLPLLVLILCFVISTGWVFAQTPTPSPEPQTITAYQEATLRIEWVKAIGTIGVILVPLLIGVFTLKSQSRTAFEIKAVELVMQSPTPWVAKKRLEVMGRMFPNRLGRLTSSFDLEIFPGIRLHDMKIELIRLLAENPDQRSFILDEWKKQFPGDEHKFSIKP